MQGIINKYSQASKFLDGIGLNPDTHPDTSYSSFNDTPISEYFRNGGVVSEEDADSAAGAIIGLPQAEYSNFNVMPLKDFAEGGMDVSYYGSLLFGTPPQELTVSVDTGSADLWIPATCPSCSHYQFTPAASSTFHDRKKKVSLVYVRGSLTKSF